MSKILVVTANFYPHITDMLLEGAKEELEKHECVYEIVVVQGALEIPVVISIAINTGNYDAYVALGCVIRGETSHYEYVAGESARALMDLSVHKQAAIGNGILTVENEEQAIKRARKEDKNKGALAVRASLAVLNIKNKLEYNE